MNKKYFSSLLALIICFSSYGCSHSSNTENDSNYVSYAINEIKNGNKSKALEILNEGISKTDDEALKNIYYSIVGKAFGEKVEEIEQENPGDDEKTTDNVKNIKESKQAESVKKAETINKPKTQQAVGYTMNEFIADVDKYMLYAYSAYCEVITQTQNDKYYQIEVSAPGYDGYWVFIGYKKEKIVFEYLMGSEYDYYCEVDADGIYLDNVDGGITSLDRIDKIISFAKENKYQVGKYFRTYDTGGYDMLYEGVYDTFDIYTNQDGILEKRQYYSYFADETDVDLYLG